MKWAITLLAFSSLLFAEAIPDVETSKGKVIDQRENYFQTSTSYRIAPNVNPITGDLIEEEIDLVVAGVENLSVRRFYSHSAIYEPRSGGWRYNPESFLVANFEWPRQECFAAVGAFNGSITGCKPSNIPYSYTFDIPKGYASFHPSGQTHPLNTKINYYKIGDKNDKHRFSWQGEVIDGSGNRRSFASNMHTWLNVLITDMHHRRRGTIEITQITPNVWTPYQLPIYEEKKPNGNIICYSYVRWKEDKLYPRPPLLNTITAYNADKTKILGSITFYYNKDKHEEVRGISAIGSDGRQVVFQHRGSSPILLQSACAPGKPSVTYGHQGQWINRVEKPEERVIATEYNAEGKVAAQYAPVGPNGEMHPIGTYTYRSHMTQFMDAEGHKVDYHFDDNKRLHTINILQNCQVYRSDHMEWDAHGNCIRKIVADGNSNVLHITEYKYDENQNPIEEKIGDGKQWYTITRTFSQDGFNLKLSESDCNEKTIHFHYKPGTNLLLAEFTHVREKICKRTFHVYDDCAVCIKIIMDDGSSAEANDLRGVTYRKVTEIKPIYNLPCFGLPEEVLEKTIDTLGNELLLKKVKYTYTPFGKILKEEHFDADDNYCYSIHNAYDDQERITSTTDPLGNLSCFGYDSNHNLTSITGPRSDQHKEIVYDKANRPVQITDWQTDGSVLFIEKKYDKLGQVIAEIDASGHETRFAYDMLGRLIATYYPDGAVEKKEYDILGNVTKIIDGEGYETRFTYNFCGKPLDIYYPNGQEEHFTYHPCGTIATHVDTNGAKSILQYDFFDQPIKIEIYTATGELLKTHTATYTPFYKLSELDGEGIETTYVYDFYGRMVAEQTDTKKTNYSYDSLGRLNQKDAQYFRIIEEHDHADNVIKKQIVDPAGNLQFQEEYFYDAAGNRSHFLTANGIFETFYNTFGKPVIEKNPLNFLTSHTYQFDKERKEIITDANGIKTIRIYDSRDQEIEILKRNCYDKTIAKSVKTYNKNGNLIQETHDVFEETKPTKTISHHWEYGPMGHIERFIEAGEKETQYFYNQGHLSTIVKPSGIRLNNEWDYLGRLTRYYSSDFDYHYCYDCNDQVLSVYDAVSNQRTTRIYNKLGCIVQETLENGLQLLNTYDDQGRRIALVLPDDSMITYNYQGVYLYSVERKGVKHFYSRRDLAGNLIQAQLPHGLGTITITRDALARWQSFESPYYNSSQIMYDPMGNLLGHNYQDLSEKIVCSYRYDDLNQLISENEHTYHFDSLFNRLKKDDLQAHVNDLCQTLHDGQRTYEYDKDGNLIFDGHWRYRYDTQDRLIALDSRDTHIEYTYDPFHRRLSKKVFLNKSVIKSVRYIWDGENEIGAISDEGKIEELRILGEGLGAEIGAAVLYELHGKPYVPLHDQRGCVVVLIDSQTQQPIENYRYTAFGEQLTTHTLSPWSFSSKRVENETGLIFFGRRYYNPTLGTWITQDPEGLDNGPNLYAYVSNCPLIRFDLYGLREYLDYDLLDFPGLSYSTLLRSNRINPYFFGFENGFIAKTSTFDLTQFGRPELPNGSWITFCNGIKNNAKEAQANLLYLSDCAGGYNLYGMHRPSHGGFTDVLECWMQYQGTITNTVLSVHQGWDAGFAKNPNGLLLHFCTSGGAITTKQALEEYPEERRRSIRVVAYAPADYIPDDICHSVTHYEAHLWRDPIPWIRWKQRWNNRHNIEVLPSHPDAPFHDHPISSKTFEQSIRYEIRHYHELIGQ